MYFHHQPIFSFHSSGFPSINCHMKPVTKLHPLLSHYSLFTSLFLINWTFLILSNLSSTAFASSLSTSSAQCSCASYDNGARAGSSKYCYVIHQTGMTCLPFNDQGCEDFHYVKTYPCSSLSTSNPTVPGYIPPPTTSVRQRCGCSYLVEGANEKDSNFCYQWFGSNKLCYPYSIVCPSRNGNPTESCVNDDGSLPSNSCSCSIYLKGASPSLKSFCTQMLGTSVMCYPGTDDAINSNCPNQNGLPTRYCKVAVNPSSQPSSSVPVCNCDAYLDGAVSSDTSSYCSQIYNNAMLCYPLAGSVCKNRNGYSTRKCRPRIEVSTPKPTPRQPTQFPTYGSNPTVFDPRNTDLPPVVGFVCYLLLMIFSFCGLYVYKRWKKSKEKQINNSHNDLEKKEKNGEVTVDEFDASKGGDDNDNLQDIVESLKEQTWWKRTFPKFMLKPHITAKDDFNRWLIPPVAIASHLCIGSVYAFSMLNEPLSRSLGVIVPSSGDWVLTQIVPTFSISIFFLGMSAAVAGKFLEEVGPRTIGTASAILWGGSWLLGGLFLKVHFLGLLYFQGVIGGCGLGLGYVSPVSTMLRWFEDRRGLAAGMAIVGFGGGAMIAAPAFSALIELFFIPPKYLGDADDVDVYTEDGKRLCKLPGGKVVEVVVATAKDIKKLGFSEATTKLLHPGVYVVGTGSTGVSNTFFVIGAIYLVVMLICAFCYRIPPPGWKPHSLRNNQATEVEIGSPQLEQQQQQHDNTTKKDEDIESEKEKANITVTTDNDSESDKEENLNEESDILYETVKEKGYFTLTPTKHHVDIDQALQTQQFYQLWINLFLNITSGIGVIAIAKTIMSDVFATSMPELVNSSFCAGYVAAISFANLLGRIIWASASDYLGRKRTFAIFFGAGAPLYGVIPLITTWVSTAPGVAPLSFFIISTLLCFSFYGGGFSTIPAYIADVFGTIHVGGIHGRLLTAWSCAGVVGPLTVTKLREISTLNEIKTLTKLVDPSAFEEEYGAPLSELQKLIDAKIVTLGNLLQLAPAGYADPTPNIYSSTFIVMGCILVVAFVNNFYLQPVHPSHWMTPAQIAKVHPGSNYDH